MSLAPNRVFVAQTESRGYAPLATRTVVPDVPADATITTALAALRALLADAKLDHERYGTPDWNPLGDLITPGAKVVLKPNWVRDRNELPDGGMECVITHADVIEAVLHYVVKTKPSQIVVGDAPIQDCDFQNLREKCRLDDMLARFERWGHDIQIRDFRLTKANGKYGGTITRDYDRQAYCLFDLADESWLAPVTDDVTEFRVACYNPDTLAAHHRPGIHRYLIAREVIDADVVINLPKLKTHKKAGVTGALKNMVGINGFKEYLPHHRKGGSLSGGDCYQGSGRLKEIAENALDRANRGKGRLTRYVNRRLAGLAVRCDKAFNGSDGNLDGAWHGNDTVWRMCLDLQRILHFGMCNGNLAPVPQRNVITITDAIVAGQGEGPLAPAPATLGLMTMGRNVAALDWVHCLLMGIHPEKVPLVAKAFSGGNWPLTDFSPSDIEVHCRGKILHDEELVSTYSHGVRLPSGWKDYREWKRCA